MTLQTQLADLTRQKKAAAKELHHTYIRTRRDVKRSLSVDRMIRRHLGASLGAAAVAGLLLAPAPSRHSTAEAEGRKSRKKKSHKLAWALSLARNLLPQAAAYIPGLARPKHDPSEADDGGESEATNPPPKKRRTLRSIIAPLLLDMAALLLQNVNFQALLNTLMGRGKAAPDEPCEGGETDAHKDAAAPAEEIPPTAPA